MFARNVGRPMLATLVSVLALWLLAGCIGQGEEDPEGSAAEQPVVGSFVGEAPEADAFVAVIADGAQQGEGAREVRAYLCDGRTINEWFVGTAVGNDVDLSSEGGSQLAANLSAGGASGTVTLPDGEEVGFRASPATGVAGLYEVSFASDSSFSGTSQDGARLLEARLGEEVNPGIRRIGGTITPAEGESQDFEAFSGREARPGEYRWIVLPDGRTKGVAKQGSGPGFIDSESDL